jgi:hypothetical protein
MRRHECRGDQTEGGDWGDASSATLIVSGSVQVGGTGSGAAPRLRATHAWADPGATLIPPPGPTERPPRGPTDNPPPGPTDKPPPGPTDMPPRGSTYRPPPGPTERPPPGPTYRSLGHMQCSNAYTRQESATGERAQAFSPKVGWILTVNLCAAHIGAAEPQREACLSRYESIIAAVTSLG